MKFHFQESKIYEGGNPVDPTGAKKTVRLQKDDETKARTKLPRNLTGRVWVLTGKEQ